MAELNYHADHEDGERSVEAVPAGEYICVVEDSDYVDNKKGTGRMLKLTYQIIDGPFKGQKIFENLSLEHENQQTVTIARKALNSLCAAVDIVELKDSSQLHNIPLRLDIGIKESEEYGKQNKIKKHLPYSEKEDIKKDSPKKESAKEKDSGAKKKHPWEK